MLAKKLQDQYGELELVAAERRERFVVIGSGPVGLRFVDEVFKLNANASIQVFGNEPSAPYNRVQLTALLAGQVSRDDIDLPLPCPATHPGFSLNVATIREIDRQRQCVVDSLGGRHFYDRLIIATGARPHIPQIPGIVLQGVYQFRRLSDTEALFARVARSRSVVVVGGGLLGIEAARALMRSGTQVTLIQQGEYLMNRQLDESASAMLRADIEALGISVITQSGVREILGDDKVSGVRIRSGADIQCDTVVVCAGIKANKELAMKAGLPVGDGIVVDDTLRTSDPQIFAIGECAEHRGQLYGLVQPGFEQAAVAARVMFKDEAVYQGSPTVSRLKVVGRAVCSMGDIAVLPKDPFISVWHYRNRKQGIYRKVILRKGRLIGALGYGEWPDSARAQQSLLDKDYVWPWQRFLFLLTGSLWTGSGANSVKSWPDSAIICQCKQVSKSEIKAIASNAPEPKLEAVQSACGASTVCGSCQTLVSELVCDEAKPIREKNAWAIALLALLAVVTGSLVALVPEAQVSDSVITKSWYESIWNDKFWKQVTGFSLLGLSALGLIMSLRKRFNLSWLGGFHNWRLVHLLLGVLAISTLVLHTGFHLGSNLNQLLMLNFLVLVAIGALAGMSISFGHLLKPVASRRLRRFWTWTHIMVSWPLPALLAVHILSVYYF